MLRADRMDRLSYRTVSVVIPVRDETPEAIAEILTVQTTDKWQETHRKWEVLVVDDGSQVPFPSAIIRHPVSVGYGAALKSGIERAVGEWIVTADGDGQHRWRDIERLVDFMEEFPENAMVIGDRRLTETTVARFWGRKVLNWTASMFAGQWIPDLNSGLRIFRREVAIGYFPILSNGFSFTTSLTVSMLADNYRVDWLPIRVLPRQNGQTKVQLWRDGWRTLTLIVRIGGALRTRGIRRVWRALHS